MSRPSRRQLVQGVGAMGLGLLAGCGPVSFSREQPARVPRIGYLGGASAGAPSEEAFIGGLHALGYSEGQNLAIEWRFAEGRGERLPALVAELIALPVDLLLTSGPNATLAAHQATTTLPIVMCYGGDPVERGLVQSLARPGGNVTGLAALTAELGVKRLELFTAALLGITRVAVLWDATAGPSMRERLQAAGRALRLQLETLEVQGPDELEAAVEAASTRRMEALFVAWDPLSFFSAYRQRIADPAARNGIPWTGGSKEFAEVGAMLSYGAYFPSIYRRAASHVDRFLKGAKPADLPVEQPTEFECVINLQTARALGLTIPPSVLAQATEVIQ